jgi:hypothetical protein
MLGVEFIRKLFEKRSQAPKTMQDDEAFLNLRSAANGEAPVVSGQGSIWVMPPIDRVEKLTN